MKKLYIDIRFAKGILTLTAGLLIAGCSAEDELGNNSSAQQLNMIPMVNDLQKSRANDEDALHEKTLSKLDFKMFEPESGKCCVNHQSSSPAENQAEVLGKNNWKVDLNLQEDHSYNYYAVANAQADLSKKTLEELQAATQQDNDIWLPYPQAKDKKFLMSAKGQYIISKDPIQDIPVELVRAAAKIKLNLSSSVNGYNMTSVNWKFLNYNTNTSVFAGQTATPNIMSNNADNMVDKIEANKCSVTTYSYSTTWTSQEDAPKIAVKVVFESKDNQNDTREKELTIPVRDPKGEKKLERNYIYTVNVDIKRLKDDINIDYDEELGYLKWAITKWTTGEDTEVDADKASYLVVYPTTLDIKGVEDDNQADKTIQWFASETCQIKDAKAYYYDRYGKENGYDYGQILVGSDGSYTDKKRGWIDLHAGRPINNTIVYGSFKVCVPESDKEQEVFFRKYPAIYSMNLKSSGTTDAEWQYDNRLYTVQFTNNKKANDYVVAKPVVNENHKSTDNTVSPAFIIASTQKSNSNQVGSYQDAIDYCSKYSESATTQNNKTLQLNGWRLPTREEVKRIYELAKDDKAVGQQVLKGAYYWTLDGNKSDYNNYKQQDGTYVRCVHDLTLDEIEDIENQQ
ncbi:hypothetical protein V7U47_02515 [Segatella copri]|uniref:fimbrial tip adhesin FimD n=1 Tax=Segatella copri TaxID=165179 RepID=UPI002FF2FF74